MTRYILIENNSGYIWGDSADLGGAVFTGSPLEFAAALDAHIGGVDDWSYEDIGRARVASNDSAYLVYSVPDHFPAVGDGQNQEMIEAVERDGEHLMTIRCIDRREDEMEKEMVQSQWFKISAFNTQPLFAFGTDQEAKTYVDLLNIDREINVYSASEIPADQCAALDSGDDTDGFRLDLAIDTIRENRLEQARAEAAMRRLD